MNHTQGRPVPDYVALGFEQINRDLAFFMNCFREVLEELGHGNLAEHLPWTGKRTTATDEMPPQLGLAYAVAFQLLNMVEERAAASIRALREAHEGIAAEKGLWGSQLKHLKQSGVTAAEIATATTTIRVEPVLTAHPTEAKRLSVLDQHRALFALIEERGEAERRHSDFGVNVESEASRATTSEVSLHSRTKAALERLWRTGEILLEKPSLTDERRNVLHYLREVFPRVLPQIDERLTLAWHASGMSEDEPAPRPNLRFGTWVGGDRDGHPGVTPGVTMETLERLRVNALLVLHRELSALADKLSLSIWIQPPPARLIEARHRACEVLGPDARPIMSSQQEEPWRQFVQLLVARLPVIQAQHTLARLREGEGLYRQASELSDDLDVLHESLCEVGARRLAAADVEPVQRALDVFGFHLAKLDVRQNSQFHAKALSQLMSASGIDGSEWEDWTETERVRFLAKELQSPRPFLHANATAGREADAVLGCYRVLAAHSAKYGPDGIGSLIVSMTRRVSDLLIVYVLAREAGLTRTLADGPACVLPVVPLFETAKDLEAAPAILQDFLEQPFTRRSLELSAGRSGAGPHSLIQQVMIGYSDSNKDAGIIASQWGLHKAQRRLAHCGRESDVFIEFFHGRGGTISRGAGPTHRFLDALPHGSLWGGIRLTEQGETIAQKYGNFSTATYNLELLLAGVTATTLMHRRKADYTDPLEPLLDELAETSRVAYRKLVEADGFLSFYRQATPIDALEHSRIGSRPSRRTGSPRLEDLRAIPWVFSWNQARFYVPGWYGTGTALAALNDKQRQIVRDSLRSHPFLHYLITNVESSLASSDLELMHAYAELVEDDDIRMRIFSQLEAEWRLTGVMIESLRGGAMPERRPRLAKTLGLRAEALRLLHRQQIRLLTRWRELQRSGDQSAADAMLPDLLLSINAIASGLRTTG